MPPISRESQSIIDYAESCAIPYRVTDINTPGVHAEGSWHYAKATGGIGTAVDFGGVVPGITPVTVVQMADIYRAFKEVAPQLAELIHNGPGTGMAVKNGRLNNGPSLFGPAVWAAHKNHVHVAVPRGTFLTPKAVTPARYPVSEVRPMWDPPLQVVDFLPYWGGSGGWMLFPDGGIGAVGDAPYRGEEHQPAGKPYWGDRRAARLERLGDGYTVVARSGERYDYP